MSFYNRAVVSVKRDLKTKQIISRTSRHFFKHSDYTYEEWGRKWLMNELMNESPNPEGSYYFKKRFICGKLCGLYEHIYFEKGYFYTERLEYRDDKANGLQKYSVLFTKNEEFVELIDKIWNEFENYPLGIDSIISKFKFIELSMIEWTAYNNKKHGIYTKLRNKHSSSPFKKYQKLYAHGIRLPTFLTSVFIRT